MGTTSDKLTYLNGTKTAIKQAIIDKGVEVSDTDTFRSYAAKIGEIPTGGGSAPVDETKPILFIDYNGDVLYSYTLEEAQALTELPPINVEHERLTFVSWNRTLAQVKAVPHGDVVGALYETTSGCLEYKIVTDAPKQRVYLPIYTSTNDWGDGSIHSSYSHIYQDAGTYWVKCTLADGESYQYLTTNQHYSNMGVIKEMYLTNVPNISDYYINHMRSVEAIVLPTISSDYVAPDLSYCYSLRGLVLPPTIKNIESKFLYCQSLKYVSLPPTKNYLLVADRAFRYCYALKALYIYHSSDISYIAQNCYSLSRLGIINSYNGIIGEYALRTNYALTTLVIPEEITKIGGYAFYDCRVLNTIICEAETPPTIEGNTFTNYNWKIYVPDVAVNAYKTATNWSTFAAYIYPMSEIGL